MIIIEVIILILFFGFFIFLLWGNFSKESRDLQKWLDKKPKSNNIEKDWVKICTKEQPYMITEKFGVICNFPCNGDCGFDKMTKEELIKHYSDEINR